jgi:toxin YoeB
MHTDPKKARRIIELIQEMTRDPFQGKGKPEPLEHDLEGCWSRRINQEHRLVYTVKDEEVAILVCRFHYWRNGVSRA